MSIEGLDDNTVIAPGAFASSVGKVVPLRGLDGGVIGTATVADADGRLELTFEGPDDLHSLTIMLARPGN